MKNLADKILSFYSSLSLNCSLPEGVEVMNPYQDETGFMLSSKFYRKYYSDNESRTLIVGINPGRFGGGITGIPFTDPVKLEKFCGIPNDLQKKTELSADFVYQMIDAYGGADKFYSKFFITSISPLGFTKEGKNLNYYDIRELQESVYPFLADSLKKIISFGMNQSVCFCLGEGQNFKFFSKLNAALSLFDNIVPLAHPRFIMQYKRKQLNTFIKTYIDKLSDV